MLQARISWIRLGLAGALFAMGSGLATADGSVNVLTNIPFSEDSRIATNIKDECTALGTKLTIHLVKFAQKKGITVVPVDELDATGPGRNLVIEITDAMSGGNAFIGHRKYMEARAELFVDGKSVGVKDYHRDSMGGFGAGWKGSCSVLGRTSKALGKDISVFLKEVEFSEAG